MIDTRTKTAYKRPFILARLAVAAALAAVGASAAALDLPPPPQESDFPVHLPAKVELGKLLFYDKILGGNQNMSCASCHHALTFLGDGLSLPVGEGGRGLGIARDTGSGEDAIHARVPRNAPHFPNGGAFEFKEQFWDGRVEEDATQPSGFRSPAGDDLPLGLDNVLAVQAMFPVTSPEEMAGQGNENDVAMAATEDPPNLTRVWDLLAQRVQDIAEYVDLFKLAYTGEVVNPTDITMVHIANAIAAYEDVEFRAINTPFDRFLRGDRRAMCYNQQSGMRLFYGKAGCSNCHSGSFQTDHQYHAVGFPQIGPGKGDPGADDDYGDFGREQVTGDSADRYKFRTPPLRNTTLTGPWGHDGAYNTLEAVIRHKMDPVASLEGYDTDQAVLPSRTDLDAIDFIHHDSAANRAAIAAAVDPLLTTPSNLTDQEVALLIEFLHALTDPSKVDLRHTVPASVPSGLPLAD